MFGGTLDSAEPVFPDIDEGLGTGRLYRLRGTIDPIEAVEELRVEGVVAQPNHVMFAHGDGCSCCGLHPSQRWGGLTGQPMHASPMHPSPMHASELQATGRRRSSAVPSGPRPRPRLPGQPARVVRVAVLDTGIAADDLRPRALDSMAPQQQYHWEWPDPDGDDLLAHPVDVDVEARQVGNGVGQPWLPAWVGGWRVLHQVVGQLRRGDLQEEVGRGRAQGGHQDHRSFSQRQAPGNIRRSGFWGEPK
jgi:hypothetical protein